MKHKVLILLFLCSRLIAQVGPPDLRCLEVLANGDIKLTWIPPSDPGGVFFSYEIFSSTNGSSFGLVTSIPAITTNSYVDLGAGGDIQSKYYFIKTKYGTGGASTSLASDTIRSMFLNIIPSTPDLKLQYNNLHQPKLSSSASAFTINKEYPASTWGILGSTSALKYSDTLSVCSASINYQISLPDNSGCISTSNIQGGIYSDKKSPNTPEVDSISVLPNGQTVLTWHIPYDKDIVDYIIYQNISGINQPIDTVKGRSTVIYTFTSTIATSSALAIYVAALDSCSKLGGFDILPTTMFLKAKYDKCAYQTVLNWNAYQGMKSGVLEYRIYYSVNGSTFLRVGSTTQTTFTHTNVAPGQNIRYFVRVINNNKNITASSNQTLFFSNQVPAAGFIYLSRASILTKNSADIRFYLDTSKSSVGIDVYRSTDGSNYSSLGFLPYNGTPYYSFTDDNIQAKSTSYFYKGVVRDSCGNARTISNVAKTILLKVEDDKEKMFTKHLTWTQYQGFLGGVSGYNIYRVINDVRSSSPVGFTGPTDSVYADVVEDEAPNGSKIEYLIEAVEGLGNPYPFQELCYSNTADIYLEGKLFVPTAFAPNGKNRVWLPVTHFVDKQEYLVSVYNRWGKKVFETADDTKGWNGDNCPPDVYVYLIRYKNSLGEYKELKGTVILLE